MYFLYLLSHFIYVFFTYSCALLLVQTQAHYIKSRRCNTAKAVLALESTYKWALSGTPLQNRVGELYSLVSQLYYWYIDYNSWSSSLHSWIWFAQVRFLQLVPYSYYLCKDCDCRTLDHRYILRMNVTINCIPKLVDTFYLVIHIWQGSSVKIYNNYILLFELPFRLNVQSFSNTYLWPWCPFVVPQHNVRIALIVLLDIFVGGIKWVCNLSSFFFLVIFVLFEIFAEILCFHALWSLIFARMWPHQYNYLEIYWEGKEPWYC